MPGRSYIAIEPMSEPEVLPWDQFARMFAQAHKQGEHVAIVGPNGSGKTLLGLELCVIIGKRMGKDRRPSRVTVLQYKPRDDTLRMVLPEKEWPVIKSWPPAYGQEHCIVWVRGQTASSASRRQRQVFLPLLDRVYVEGGQTVYIPEAAHIERPLPSGCGMSSTMEEFWGSARSNKLTVISDTQRPRHVTLLMWTEPAWLMIYRLEHHEDIKTVAKASGFEREVWSIVPKLGEHEFMCVRRQRHAGKMGIYVSKVDVTRDNRDKER